MEAEQSLSPGVQGNPLEMVVAEFSVQPPTMAFTTGLALEAHFLPLPTGKS